MKKSEQENIFTAWLREHKGLLFKIVRAYAYTVEDRDDLFQEITVQVWHSIPKYRGEAAVTTWLYRIAFFAASAGCERKRSPKGKAVIGRSRTYVDGNHRP